MEIDLSTNNSTSYAIRVSYPLDSTSCDGFMYSVCVWVCARACVRSYQPRVGPILIRTAVRARYKERIRQEIEVKFEKKEIIPSKKSSCLLVATEYTKLETCR